MLKIIVVDTSVFISALLGPRGASRAVVRACLQKRFQPLMGTTLFLEYEALMAREVLFAGCPLTPVEREALLDAFLSVCRWTTVYYTWRPNLRDESDNHLIELAVAGGAQAIVTKNVKDFIQADLQFPSLRFLKPDQLLKEVH